MKIHVVESEAEAAPILRRNSLQWKKSHVETAFPRIVRSVTLGNITAKFNPKRIKKKLLNSFNDMGHLSRRIFKEGGEDHMKHEDFESSFGFRKVLDSDMEVTAITANTISICLSSILHDLIVSGEKLVEEGHVNAQRYDVFCGCGVNNRSSYLSADDYTKEHPIPTIEMISSFVSKLCNESFMEYECIIISLVYVRRLIKMSNGQLVLLRDNWKGIILSCIMLSNQMWDDFHLLNADYCYIFKSLTVERVNSLELQLLNSIGYRSNVSPSAYARTHFEVQAMITLSHIEKYAQCPVTGSSKHFKPSCKVDSDENTFPTATVVVSKNLRPPCYPLPRSDSQGTDCTDISGCTCESSLDEYCCHDQHGKDACNFHSPTSDCTSCESDSIFSPSGDLLIRDMEEQSRIRVKIHYDENSNLAQSPTDDSKKVSVKSRHGAELKACKRKNNVDIQPEYARLPAFPFKGFSSAWGKFGF